jgi:hypothetical protein
LARPERCGYRPARCIRRGRGDLDARFARLEVLSCSGLPPAVWHRLEHPRLLRHGATMAEPSLRLDHRLMEPDWRDARAGSRRCVLACSAGSSWRLARPALKSVQRARRDRPLRFHSPELRSSAPHLRSMGLPTHPT